MPVRVRLPKYIYLQPEDKLVHDIASVSDGDKCIIDASRLAFISPAGLVWLASAISDLKSRGCAVTAVRLQHSMKRFFDRMNLVEAVRSNHLTYFKRLPKPMKFVEVRRFGITTDTDALAMELARSACQTESHDTQLTLRYCLSEAMNNVRQHSGSDGFVSSMYYPCKGKSLVAISDFGVGLRQHLTNNPELRGSLSDDIAAAKLAIKRDTSGHPHQMGAYDSCANTGNGLYFLDQICRLCKGRMTIWSGKGCGEQRAGRWKFLNRPPTTGVLLVLEFLPKMMLEYREVMEDIRTAYTGGTESPITFE